MATFNITHIVRDGSGTLLAGVELTARLNKPAFKTSDNSQMAKIDKFTTDSVGAVTLVLEATADMTPVDTYYIVEVKIPASQGGPELYTIRSTADQTLNQSKVIV